MSCAIASEDAKDRALEVLAIYLTDDELVDFSNYNMQGASSREDRDKFTSLTNKHQQALWQLGEAMIDGEVEGEGALEVFADMLAMTEDALRQLRQGQAEDTPGDVDAPEVGGGSPKGDGDGCRV